MATSSCGDRQIKLLGNSYCDDDIWLVSDLRHLFPDRLSKSLWYSIKTVGFFFVCLFLINFAFQKSFRVIEKLRKQYRVSICIIPVSPVGNILHQYGGFVITNEPILTLLLTKGCTLFLSFYLMSLFLLQDSIQEITLYFFVLSPQRSLGLTVSQIFFVFDNPDSFVEDWSCIWPSN